MHIWLINTNPLFTHIVVDYLVHNGHKVDIVKDLNMPQETPDVVIVEMIPTPSNLKQLQNMHQQHPQAPIVLVHDQPTRLQLSEAHQCGIHAYLRKPFSLFELDMIIWQVTQQAHAQKSL